MERVARHVILTGRWMALSRDPLLSEPGYAAHNCGHSPEISPIHIEPNDDGHAGLAVLITFAR